MYIIYVYLKLLKRIEPNIKTKYKNYDRNIQMHLEIDIVIPRYLFNILKKKGKLIEGQ